jgi:hypothetical protein
MTGIAKKPVNMGNPRSNPSFEYEAHLPLFAALCLHSTLLSPLANTYVTPDFCSWIFSSQGIIHSPKLF